MLFLRGIPNYHSLLSYLVNNFATTSCASHVSIATEDIRNMLPINRGGCIGGGGVAFHQLKRLQTIL